MMQDLLTKNLPLINLARGDEDELLDDEDELEGKDGLEDDEEEDDDELDVSGTDESDSNDNY